VFISYARHDKPFVHDLCTRLATDGRDVWVDWDDIPPTSNLAQRNYAGIEGADTFVFVITPASARSEMCRKELAHAELHNKRLVPVLRADVETGSLPEGLASREWVLLRESDDLADGSRRLDTALNTDLEWVRAHTRLLVRAIEWERASRDTSLTLRGQDLQKAEGWLAVGAQNTLTAAERTTYLH
jgi:hypothetical protein